MAPPVACLLPALAQVSRRRQPALRPGRPAPPPQGSGVAPRPLPERLGRSAGPAPTGASPPPAHLHARPPAPRPLASAGPTPPPGLRPEPPELRAAGGLLNRGGPAGAGALKRRAARRAGRRQLDVVSAAPERPDRRGGAAGAGAPQQASGRRRLGGGLTRAGLVGPDGQRGRDSEARRGARGPRQPPRPPSLGVGSWSRIAVGPQPNLNGRIQQPWQQLGGGRREGDEGRAGRGRAQARSRGGAGLGRPPFCFLRRVRRSRARGLRPRPCAGLRRLPSGGGGRVAFRGARRSLPSDATLCFV